MKQRKSDPSNDYIPTDYEDLYRHYILGDGHGNSLCHKIVRHYLPYSDSDERETLAHDVFLRLIEKDMLKVFDPDKANFGGVIFFVTRTICVNHLARKQRNPLTGLNGGSLLSRDLEEGEFEPGLYSLDRLFGTEAPRYEDQMTARKIVGELVTWAKGLYDAPRHKRDQSLYPLLGLLADQHDPKECGAQLGVTPSTIHNWIEVLRGKAREIQEHYA